MVISTKLRNVDSIYLFVFLGEIPDDKETYIVDVSYEEILKDQVVDNSWQ